MLSGLYPYVIHKSSPFMLLPVCLSTGLLVSFTLDHFSFHPNDLLYCVPVYQWEVFPLCCLSRSRRELMKFWFALELAQQLFKTWIAGDFPSGTSACQCRVHGFNPWSGKIPCHGASEPILEAENCNYWNLCAQSLCSLTRKAITVRSLCTAMKSSPCLLQQEKALMHLRRPSTTKNKINNF